MNFLQDSSWNENGVKCFICRQKQQAMSPRTLPQLPGAKILRQATQFILKYNFFHYKRILILLANFHVHSNN